MLRAKLLVHICYRYNSKNEYFCLTVFRFLAFIIVVINAVVVVIMTMVIIIVVFLGVVVNRAVAHCRIESCWAGTSHDD